MSASSGSFFEVPFEELPQVVNHNVNSMFADDDQLAKQGRVGKWVSKNRTVFGWLVVIVAMIGIGTCLYAFFGFFGWFWGLAAGQSHGLFQNTLKADTVRLDNGQVVERVVEPRGLVSIKSHATLLYYQMKDATPLTRADVARGYSQWVASQSEGLHNFTFRGAMELAQQQSTPCVCFYELGLPIKAVYVAGEILFEPSCEDKYGSPTTTIEGINRGPFYTLYQDVIQFMKTDNDARLARYKPLVTTKSGVVDCISSKSGARTRKLYDNSDVYVCIKNCVLINE